MPQFTSSTKPLLSFAETELIKKLRSACGDRLTELTQMEKYQLSAAITIHLWGCAEDIESPGGYDDDDDDGLVSTAEHFLDFPLGLTGNVKAVLFILDQEDPDNLAAILPAIVSYAREDERLHT